jgi:hypothetical protein
MSRSTERFGCPRLHLDGVVVHMTGLKARFVGGFCAWLVLLALGDVDARATGGPAPGVPQTSAAGSITLTGRRVAVRRRGLRELD